MNYDISLFVLVIAMAVFAYTDIKERRIPNPLLLTLLLSWGVLRILQHVFPAGERAFSFVGVSITGALLGAAICGGIFLLAYILGRGKLGAGDVKLAFVTGLFMGIDSGLMAMLIGMIAYVLYVLVFVRRKKISLKDALPLAPFILAGVVTVLFLK
ncbi:MAG: A24 family peptidase [Butyrivibrio sp.]|nr:A24 family peptidase [Butyrivibrio sp.]